MNFGCRLRMLLVWPLILLGACCWAQKSGPYQYLRVGNAADASGAAPKAGYALMGGGTDLDEAFQWLCGRGSGGDFLVLRATGTDAYNAYIRKLCPKLNSVATLIVPSREAAGDPEVARRIAEASSLFISGGDQANYINFWMGTPVEAALNDAIARGVPMGGTSAGLAVLGEWAYSAQGDKPEDADLGSALAMGDPFGPRITLVHGFLRIPALRGILTDTHFARRNRMGRLLVFLARQNQPGNASARQRIRGIGVEQGAAVLLEPDGEARVIGRGDAYFIDPPAAAGKLAKGVVVSAGPFQVQKVAPGHAFSLRTWSGDATHYTLTVKDGEMHSTQSGGSVY